MKRFVYYLIACTMGWAAASCSSTKRMAGKSTIGNLAADEYVREVIVRSPEWKAVTAKMQLTLTRSAEDIQVSGSLKMKRDEVIVLSISPVLGIEVARVEITPQDILVIDRIHKRYVRVPFSEIREKIHADLDYHAFQSLFLNEIFLPGKNRVTTKDVNAFTVRQDTSNVILEVKDATHFLYRFTTTITEGLLKQTHVGVADTEYGIKWQYGNFRELDGKRFPATMFVAVEGSNKSMTALFNFSRLSTNEDWEGNTQLSDRYERIALDELLKMIFK